MRAITFLSDCLWITTGPPQPLLRLIMQSPPAIHNGASTRLLAKTEWQIARHLETIRRNAAMPPIRRKVLKSPSPSQ